MPANPAIYRFAPSPNGELHLGHAFSAILNYQLARRTHGTFLLRIEDIDLERSTLEHKTAIYRDLTWLGLEWQIPVRQQSEHFGTYRAALSKLESLGLLYPCFATRKEIMSALANKKAPDRDPDGALIYPGLYKHMDKDEIQKRRANGEPFALRLDMTKAIALIKKNNQFPLTYKDISTDGKIITHQTDPTLWGDVIIARKNIPTSYHLSVVVDDAIQNVTHIVRGRDLKPATSIHRLLQIFLELPEPVYHHHPLLLDDTEQKLSKSNQSDSLRVLRETGVTPEMIWQELGFHQPTKSE